MFCHLFLTSNCEIQQRFRSSSHHFSCLDYAVLGLKISVSNKVTERAALLQLTTSGRFLNLLAAVTITMLRTVTGSDSEPSDNSGTNL